MIWGSHARSAASSLTPAPYHYENTSNIRQIIYQCIDTDQSPLNKVLGIARDIILWQKIFVNSSLMKDVAIAHKLIRVLHVFFKMFLEDIRPFRGALTPLFWTLGDVYPGFQSRGGFLACRLFYLHAIPQIHFWCDPC